LRPGEGGAENFGGFCGEKHGFSPKNFFFFNYRGVNKYFKQINIKKKALSFNEKYFKQRDHTFSLNDYKLKIK
jgi:hypothetical protein